MTRAFALALAAVLAGCATPARGESAMAPLAPLIGCWRGAFENAADIHDERCFEPMLGGRYVRDVHAVRPTEYAGETIYYADAGRALFFTSDGGMSRGGLRAVDGALVFDAHVYVGADGREQRLRSTWRLQGEDRFAVETEREEAGVWRSFMRIAYTRQ